MIKTIPVSLAREALRKCLFSQTLRYAQKIILKGNRACETPISTICLRLFFEQALILKKKCYSRKAC
ncbi:MAG: hypothetical protein DRH24_05305 [Deltaproteobacteria bacterium]|nr:MAG: hypothetical protein DRH24_05305 [Deltaproteobacteria bacterium]